MIGILCEKPSAMKNFSKALGGKSGVFNGESYVLTCSHGHLFGFKDPSEMVPSDKKEEYKTWDLASLPWNEKDFSWVREKKPDAGVFIKNIKDTLSGCDEIAVATDVDPSGEGYLLAAEILEELNLVKSKTKLSRIYFMDESPKEIQKGFVNRKTLKSIRDHDEFRMADYRTKWDMLSMQFTRIATKYGDGRSVLRQGRLKSAMVKITGDGLKALAEYKPIPFFQNRFKDENGVVYTNKEEPQYDKKESVPNTYTDSDVVFDGRERKTTAPPKLLDLASLSAILAGKGYKAQYVLSVYQKMYEDQVVSYPRTEDKVITPEQYNELLSHAKDIARVVGVDTSKLTHTAERSTHVKTGGAHGANRPGPKVPSSLADVKKEYGEIGVEIYRTLALNSLAMLAEDYEYDVETGHVAKYPDFIGTASVPQVRGWKDVYNDETKKDQDEDDENDEGIGKHAKPFIHEGTVGKKPPKPTTKWLMKQLEKHDVGTGATRTSIYAEVTSEAAKYPLLKETKGVLSMTQFGEMSYNLLPGTHIGDLKITEALMSDMKEIGKNKKDPDECLHEMQQLIKDDMAAMKQNAKTSPASKPAAGTADEERYKGVWKGKPVSFKRLYRGKILSVEECESLCQGKEVPISGFVGKSGSLYGVLAVLKNMTYNGYDYVGVDMVRFLERDELDVPDDQKARAAAFCKCPKCGKNILELPSVYACEDKKCGCVLYKDDKYFSKLGKQMTPEIAKALFERGGVKTTVINSYSQAEEKVLIKVVFEDKYPKYSIEKTEHKK